jgi:hypothetical protein
VMHEPEKSDPVVGADDQRGAICGGAGGAKDRDQAERDND